MHIANNGNNSFVGMADAVYLAWYLAGNPNYTIEEKSQPLMMMNMILNSVQENDITIKIGEVSANPGDKNIRIPVTFENNAGIGGALLEFDIPAGLTLVDIERPDDPDINFLYYSGSKKALLYIDLDKFPEGYKGEWNVNRKVDRKQLTKKVNKLEKICKRDGIIPDRINQGSR